MKKWMKTGIAVLGALLIIALSLALFVRLKFAFEARKLRPVQSGEIMPGIFAVRNSTPLDLYLVRGSDGYVAFDTGEFPSETRAALRTLGIDPGEVRALFLTHTDWDHVDGVGLFRNARVYLSRDEEQMIDGRTARGPLFRNRLAAAHRLLTDGETVTAAGLTVQAISTPGHTPGAICYLVDGAHLFTGDTMSLKGGRADIYNSFFNMDDDRERLSIRKLAKLRGVRDIFTAHYGYATDFSRAFAGWK